MNEKQLVEVRIVYHISFSVSSPCRKADPPRPFATVCGDPSEDRHSSSVISAGAVCTPVICPKGRMSAYPRIGGRAEGKWHLQKITVNSISHQSIFVKAFSVRVLCALCFVLWLGGINILLGNKAPQRGQKRLSAGCCCCIVDSFFSGFARA